MAYKYRHKNPKQIVSKYTLATYKMNNVSQLNGIYFKKQSCLSIPKPINVIYHVIRIKVKKIT